MISPLTILLVTETCGYKGNGVTWNVFVEKPDGTFRVHYRSKGPVINELAAKHDGGGHALASGANAKDMDEVKQVFAEVVEVTKKFKEDHE